MYVGPDIVQDGLVVVLDAGSTRSYPGTGATWFDLSGNGNDGTLSATSIGTTTSGTMTFDGVDDTVTINYPNLTSSNFLYSKSKRPSLFSFFTDKSDFSNKKECEGSAGPNNFISS